MEAPTLLPGAPALKCPGCGTQVADGTSICPKCDYIIDASFLSSEPPKGGDDDEATGAAEDPRKAAPPARPARPRGTGSTSAVSSTGTRRVATSSGKTGSRSAVKAVPSDGTARSKPNLRAVSKPVSRSVPAVRPAPQPAEPRASEMELDDAEPRKPLLPPNPPSRGQVPSTTGKIVAPEELISDAREFVGGLTRSDKIAFAGACVVIFSCFLPWKETAADGEVLGLMSAGAGALLSAAIVISSIFIRVRRTLPKFNPLVPWGTQVGMSFFCLLYTVIFIKTAFDTTEVPSAIGNQLIMNSSPSFGVFLGLLGTMTALAGSIMGLRERT